MRLIDADLLIKEIRKWYWDEQKRKVAQEDINPADLFTSLAITTVEKQPTAYDVDKVVEHLEEIKEVMTSPASKDCFGDECEYQDCTVCIISRAIEAVKGGGVE